MPFKYFHIAWQYLKQRQSRSLLTVGSIVFGVSSVILLVNFGSGVRQQVTNDQVFNQNLITIQSGQVIVRDEDGRVVTYNPAQTMGVVPNLSLKDVRSLDQINRIVATTPIAPINERITNLSGDRFLNGHVLATDANFLGIINYQLAAGTNVLNSDKATVIIGSQVAKELFNNSRPISHEITVGQKSFIVAGVLEDNDQLNPLNLNFNYQRSILMPFKTFEQANLEEQLETRIYKIIAQTERPADSALLTEIKAQILSNHQQKEDFSVFQNNELLFLVDDVFDFFTVLIVAISVIFIGAGGISLMNAMQASVAERAAEISLRKAVGASNQQILNQFLLEALLLSGLGHVGGIVLALILGLAIDYWSPIEPILQIKIIVYVLLLIPVIAFIFGGKAAIQAALQKPADHLNQ